MSSVERKSCTLFRHVAQPCLYAALIIQIIRNITTSSSVFLMQRHNKSIAK